MAATRYIQSLSTEDGPDLQDVLHRLGLLTGDINQTTLRYLVQVMVMFPTNLEVQRLAVGVIVRAAAFGRPSSSGTIGAEDIIESHALRAVSSARKAFHDDVGFASAYATLCACLSLNHICKGLLLHSDAIDLLVQTVEQFASTREVVLQGLTCMRFLATVLDFCPLVHAKGLLLTCLKASGGYRSDIEICAAEQHCLWNLAAEDGMAEVLVAQGALKLAVSSMKRMGREPKVLAPGNGLLMNIARLDHLLHHVADARGLKQILDSMHHFPLSEEVLPNAIGALSLFANTSEYKRKVLTAGLGTVVQVMEAQMDNLETLLLVTGLLVVMTSEVCPELNGTLLPSLWTGRSALEVTCAVMHRYEGNRDLMHRGMAVLLNVAQDPRSVQEVQAKGLDRILFVSRTFKDDVPMMAKCNHLLAEMAADEAILKSLLQAGALPDLIGSMKQFSSVSAQLMGAACHLTAVLAVNSEYRAEIIEGDVIEMVLKAMAKFPDNASFLTDASAALWCLAHEKAGKDRIFHNGGMALLKARMDAFPADAALWRAANGVLRSLITEDSYAAAFLDMFGADLQDEPDYTVRLTNGHKAKA